MSKRWLFVLAAAIIIAIVIGVAASYVVQQHRESALFDVYSSNDGEIFRMMLGWTHRVRYLGSAPMTDVYIFVNGRAIKTVPLMTEGWFYGFSTWEVPNSTVTVTIIWNGGQENYSFKP
jgi:hypothetical protein